MLRLAVYAFYVLAMIVFAQAHALPPAIDRPLCTDRSIISNHTILVGANQVKLTRFSCAGDPIPAIHARQTPRNTCGDVCSAPFGYCESSGPEPDLADCITIANAIGVLSAQLGRRFVLNAANGYYLQLEYQTCLAYIGDSAQSPVDVCWSDFANEISTVSNACFPGNGQYAGCTTYSSSNIYDYSMGTRHS